MHARGATSPVTAAPAANTNIAVSSRTMQRQLRHEPRQQPKRPTDPRRSRLRRRNVRQSRKPTNPGRQPRTAVSPVTLGCHGRSVGVEVAPNALVLKRRASNPTPILGRRVDSGAVARRRPWSAHSGVQTKGTLDEGGPGLHHAARDQPSPKCRQSWLALLRTSATDHSKKIALRCGSQAPIELTQAERKLRLMNRQKSGVREN